MNKEKVLDSGFEEIEEKPFFKFQIIEITLIGIFCSLLFLKPFIDFPKIEPLVLAFSVVVMLSSIVRVYFEYKEKLITEFGIILKVILLINTSVILIGVLFRLQSWPYASEMITTSLLSIGFIYALYILCLKNVSGIVKLILFINSLFTGVLAIGMLFRIQSWPYGSELVIVGFIVTVISFPFCGYLLNKGVNRKEKYNIINYLARSLIILLFGYSYLF